MDNRKNEQVIYLKDLLFVLLHGWRSLLAVAIAFALVLGGLKFVRDIRNPAQSSQPEQQQLLENAEEALTRAQEAEKGQKEYMEQSICQRLDADKYYLAELVYFVQKENASVEQKNEEDTGLMDLYASSLYGSASVMRISDAAEERFEYFREVYTVELNQKGTTITIKCACDTKDVADKVVRAIDGEMELLYEKILPVGGNHTLTRFESNVSEQSSTELMQYQHEAEERLAELEKEADAAAAEKAALAAPAEQSASKSQAIKSAAKFAVLGAAVGVVVVAAYLWLRHVFGNKVYSARILSNVTGVRVIGAIMGTKKRNAVDRWLRKLEGRNTGDVEMHTKRLIADVRNRCAGVDRLLVTGDGDNQYRQAFVSSMSAELTGIQVMDGGNLMQDGAAVEGLAQCDAVLLVEQCGCSVYTKVEQEMTMLSDYGKKLIGCVLLDG